MNPSFILGDIYNEKNLPAQQNPSQKNARFPYTHENRCRPHCACPQAREGTQEISRLTFGSEHRLRSRAQFTVCYTEGERFFLKNFVVFAHFDPQDHASWKMGAAVSKKCGSAPQRNRIKRVLREFIRLHQEQLPPFIRLVFVPKKHLQADSVSLSSVSNDLLPLLSRLPNLSPTPAPKGESHVSA